MNPPMLPDDETLAFGERGYFIRDRFIAGDEAADIAAYAKRMVEVMKPAGIGPGGRRDTTVRGDFSTWLDDSPMHPLFEKLMHEINGSAYLGLRNFQVQLAYYPGEGAHYVRHTDAPPGHNIRRVTALLYLNADWKPEHGGELRMHVDPPRDVAPELGRLVVFLSERVEHEVLPAFAPRFAATAWYRAV